MSGMTDADYLDAIANGRYQVIESAAHHKERLRHIAARLRGDGEQYPEAAEVCGEAYQVVGSLLDDLGVFNTPQAEKVLDNLSQHRMVHKDVLPWPSFAALAQDRASQPVAGDAVRALLAEWRGYKGSIYADNSIKQDTLADCADELEVALSTQPAPSEQVAASVAVPDGMLGRLEEAARRIENGYAPRRIPADPSDLDLVIAEVIAWLKGEAAPFWVPSAPTQGAEPKPADQQEAW